MALPAALQNFADGPKLPKIVLGLLGLVALLAGGYFLLLSPVQVRVDALVVKQKQAQDEVNKVRAQVAEIERFKREIAELEKRLALLKDRLPSDKETPTLYRAVSSAAEQSGLGVSLFQPKAAVPKDVVSEIPITISAQGSYHQLAKFFERVAGLPRVVNVNDFKMTGLGKSKDSMKADLTLATYMYRTAPPPPPAKPGAPAAAPAKPSASLPDSSGARS
ncbi:MAG TPA: type 4a pilus biogenesis protein PilO [Methylomirabilota bacterium]|jgi:type IV pilus assembly protein PilO|nr:type 4a pilus biogenesis protein PilO [Methylomirabilota bacterium]